MSNPFDSDDDADVAVATAQAEQSQQTRVCDEPRSIAESMQAVCERYMQGVDDPAKHEHPFGGTCKVCDKPLDSLWRQIDHPGAPGYFPVNCCDACYAAAQVDQDREKRNREMWERICPTEFRPDWDNKKGSEALFKRCMLWANEWNVTEKKSPRKGLVIHGDSDSAKTRVAWQLYKRLATEGVGVLFVDAADLLDEIPKEAFTVQVLIIDDLGNDLMDAKKEQRLLRLLRHRAQWHKHIVVTSQYVGGDMIKRFKQQAAGEAAVRRLRDMCDSVNARKPGDGGIQRNERGEAVMS